MPITAAILDVDGTLVDSNYQHALAWSRAFRDAADLTLPIWQLHRHIGMGGDKFVAAVAGEAVERERGDDIRESEADNYRELIDEVVPLPGASELVEALKKRDLTVVLASSAKEWEVDHYIDVLGIRELADSWTTSADVEATKPEPDLVETALEKAGSRAAAMLGDTTWDVKAASRAGIPSIALLTGGFGEEELRATGALEVFESPAELLDRLDETPFAGR